MRKSMDDESLRQQIIELLPNAGSTSDKEDLNVAVMNMLKILPPPIVKLKAKESMPTSMTLFKGATPYPSLEKYNFTFINLFAGIGGFRLAFQKAGGCSVCNSEWDTPAQKTYKANYGEIPIGDIRAKAAFSCITTVKTTGSAKTKTGIRAGAGRQEQKEKEFKAFQKQPRVFTLDAVGKRNVSVEAPSVFSYAKRISGNLIGFPVINVLLSWMDPGDPKVVIFRYRGKE